MARGEIKVDEVVGHKHYRRPDDSRLAGSLAGRNAAAVSVRRPREKPWRNLLQLLRRTLKLAAASSTKKEMKLPPISLPSSLLPAFPPSFGMADCQALPAPRTPSLLTFPRLLPAQNVVVHQQLPPSRSTLTLERELANTDVELFSSARGWTEEEVHARGKGREAPVCASG